MYRSPNSSPTRESRSMEDNASKINSKKENGTKTPEYLLHLGFESFPAEIIKPLLKSIQMKESVKNKWNLKSSKK